MPIADGMDSLAALRQRVRALETLTAIERLASGAEGLDARLPGGGLAWGALHEVSPAMHFEEPSAAAFLLAWAVRALERRPGKVFWVRGPGGESGELYGPGLAGFGLDPARLVLVEAPDAKSALWAGEEIAKSPGAAALLLETGRPLDLTASRRLQLAAEAGDNLALILTSAGQGCASVARTVWRVRAQSSARPAWAERLPTFSSPPGAPSWRVELLRAKGGAPANLDLEWNFATRSFRLAEKVADRAGPAHCADAA